MFLLYHRTCFTMLLILHWDWSAAVLIPQMTRRGRSQQSGRILAATCSGRRRKQQGPRPAWPQSTPRTDGLHVLSQCIRGGSAQSGPGVAHTRTWWGDTCERTCPALDVLLCGGRYMDIATRSEDIQSRKHVLTVPFKIFLFCKIQFVSSAIRWLSNEL